MQSKDTKHIETGIHARDDRKVPRGDDGAGPGEIRLVGPGRSQEFFNDGRVLLHSPFLRKAVDKALAAAMSPNYGASMKR
jgi:hypothetical protein